MAGPERRPPPGEERLARPEREVAPLAGLQQQVVEAVEGDLGRLGRRGEALPHPARRHPPVVADDDDAARPRPSGSAAGSTCAIAVERGRPRRDPASGSAHPVARRLDLLDRVEADRARAGAG